MQSNDLVDFLYYFSKEHGKQDLPDLLMYVMNLSRDSIYLRVRW